VADARVIRGELSPEDLAVWAIGTPDALAAAARDRAQDVLARRGSYLLASRTRDGGLTPWTPYGQGGGTVAAGGVDGGLGLRVERRPGQDFAGATQTINLNAREARPLTVTAQGQVEQVSGAKDRDLGVYVDCYYTDGSAIYGQTAPLDPTVAAGRP